MDLTRTPVLECQDLCFSYAGTSIFKNISLKVDPGIFCAILGRNGSGKTTLIHCLNQTLVSESGQVKNIHDMRPGQIARQVSLVPQEQLDIFPFKVLDVVVMGRAPFLGLAQRPGPKDYDLAAQALDHLNAGHLADKAFNRISGGEKQRAFKILCQLNES
ncbi:MAG: ABC transporter ATP-binding protein [Desulfobacter sp.]|nr:ABC transporter ATP-binding protein [Desulfobacter sp.]